MTEDKEMLSRWRLILGQFAEESLPLDDMYSQEEDCLAFLYDREYSADRGIRGGIPGFGGRGGSVMNVPDWLRKVKRLFPKSTAEILQKDALSKYGIDEMLTNPEILRTLEPDINLLAKLLTFRGIIPPAVKAQADEIIRKAAEDIEKKLETEVKRSICGRKSGEVQSCYKVFRNFDFKRTVERNLKNYNARYGTIIPNRLYFRSNIKRYNSWDIIILADQSGSMAESVIYTSIMAAIFAKLPFLSTKLAVFDTNIVDLSDYTYDCTEMLMKIQLGGGTDIYKALCYGESLISRPQRTIVILITDLYEGGDIRRAYGKCRDILEGGSRLIVLPALNYEAEPVYNRSAAKYIANLGADTAALTPEELADWIGNIMS